VTQLTSPAAGKPYPVTMACRVLRVPRASFYDARKLPVEELGDKRGPKTELSDERLLDEIRTALDESKFHGEGHRKVRAKLAAKGLYAGKNRILRIMRENQLLAPTRQGSPHGPKAHDGTIVTDRPDEMWGVDGTLLWTNRHGWVWWFGLIDHYTGEILGWSMAKVGTRFVAMDPVRQACARTRGSAHKDIARGVALRCDHGTQFTSKAFRAEMRHLGIDISWAFVREPQGNGCIERFIRTLKEQCVWLHHFDDLDQAKAAIGAFIDDYNNHWMLERLGYRTPAQAREDHESRRFATAA
jgi:putative transposase